MSFDFGRGRRQRQGSGRTDNGETQLTATFVSHDAPDIHGAFGGSAQFDSETGHFAIIAPYRNLALALQEYVPQNDLSLGVVLGNDTPQSSWDTLFDRLNQAHGKASAPNTGPLEIFKKMWLRVGESADVIDPWVNLIPDSYGLSVVKAAVGIILTVAERSAEKRQKLFDAFTGIRDIIGEANSKRKSFQTDPEVSRCATQVYETIVEAIEEILETLPPPKKPFEWKRAIPRLGKKQEKTKKKAADPLIILERVRDSAKELVRAVDRRRDDIIETTGELSEFTSSQVMMIRWIVTEADLTAKETQTQVGEVQIKLEEVDANLKSGVGLLQETRDQQHLTNSMLRQASSRMANMNQTIEQKIQYLMDQNLQFQNDRTTASDQLMELLLEERRKNAELKRRNRDLKRQQSQQSQEEIATATRNVVVSNAIVSLDRLYEIICQPVGQINDNAPIPDVDSTLASLNDDLELAVKWRTRLDLNAQGQAQTIFQHDRFLDWIKRRHPDILLVDGNISSGLRDKVSAMSLFCANFILSTAKLEPDDVITHFFCGMHTGFRDPWRGATGLIRSLIIQLLAALDDQDLLTLEFLSRRSQLRELEAHSLDGLCDLLHELVRQFPAGRTVYCIIDGISYLEANSPPAELSRAIEALDGIVTDDELKPQFKVLMTVPGRSSLRLKRMVDESCQIALSATRALVPRPMTERWLTAEVTAADRPLSRGSSHGRWSGSHSGRSQGSYSGRDNDDDDDADDRSDVD
ncbi:hypothetical protein B0H66DRAFT_604253 [Apodospora peruviana]|uniref:Nephrocystin 3-like N-terminal domain-containing protein n=1 Tax=Apodospora peruviana TaxID=516989 RepID=A0AAE0M1S8_9PEZI|nr:hypothetical protein B0H66DRAFT_604253 [Apodospora peruviana]